MTRRVLRRSFLLVIAALLAGAGGWYAYWDRVEHRLRTVTDGKIYQSAAMPPDDLRTVVREYGIRTVVDLREAEDDARSAERKALEAAGVAYRNLPTPQIPTDATIDEFLALAGTPDALPLLVHCEHGEGRSVLFAALYRIEFEGWTNEEARQDTRLFPGFSSFRRGAAKGDFLLRYRRRRSGALTLSPSR